MCFLSSDKPLEQPLRHTCGRQDRTGNDGQHGARAGAVHEPCWLLRVPVRVVVCSYGFTV